MIKNNFNWNYDWNKVKELYDQLKTIIEAEEHYMHLRAYDKKMMEKIHHIYPMVDEDENAIHKDLAEKANSIIEKYVMDEEA